MRPGKLSYAPSGIGSSGHISSKLFNMMAKIKVVHVPYKGSAEGVSTPPQVVKVAKAAGATSN